MKYYFNVCSVNIFSNIVCCAKISWAAFRCKYMQNKTSVANEMSIKFNNSNIKVKFNLSAPYIKFHFYSKHFLASLHIFFFLIMAVKYFVIMSTLMRGVFTHEKVL